MIKNLSFTISRDSNGIIAYSYLSLSPNSTYLFSFNFNTTGTLDTYYSKGQNGGMVFYNVTPTFEHIIGGPVITINPEKFANRTYRSLFRTPNFNVSLSAILLFQMQPPLHHDTINVSISNVSIVKVNGSNMFLDLFKPVKTKGIGPTSFFLSDITMGNHISIDQTFGQGWVLAYSNGMKTGDVQGTFGQVSFNANVGGNATLMYEPQSHYTILLYISFGSISIFLVFFSVLVVARKLKV